MAGCTQKKQQAPLRSPDYPKARALDGTKNDSAFYLYSRVVNSSEDSFEIGSSYNRMALMQCTAGDYFGSQESALQSKSYLNSEKESDLYWIASNYGILGKASLSLRQYNKAVAWFDSALKYETNPDNDAYYLNNKAVAFEKIRRYEDAIKIYQAILEQKPDSITEYARVLSNLAIVKWLNDSTYPAALELQEALAIRKARNDSWGLNASYAQLSDFYSQESRDSALYFARQMYATAMAISSAEDQLEALDKLIRLEQPVQATKYFTRYMKLNDSLQQARNAAKNQFADVRFDAEKTKAENLVLQKDNMDKRERINRQRLTFFSVISIFALTLIIAILWYKKRKQRFILQSDNAVKEQELKMSQKVHDVVANGLYRLMSEMEHSEMEKEKLLDKMEDLYEHSRDISYEPTSLTQGPYEEKISDLLSAFSSPSVKVLIVGNNTSFWKDILMDIRNELEHILQELMINMKKHSHANNVVIKFDRDKEYCSIRYSDDGIGLTKPFKVGNGLTNTGNRILAIGGAINFESDLTKGFGVTISFSTKKK